jgi:hypothetical protein
LMHAVAVVSKLINFMSLSHHQFQYFLTCGIWMSRLLEGPSSQQLFKVFIYIYFAATCFGPRWPSSGGIHNIFGKLPHYDGSVFLCYESYFVYGLANTAVVYLNVTVR